MLTAPLHTTYQVSYLDQKRKVKHVFDCVCKRHWIHKKREIVNSPFSLARLLQMAEHMHHVLRSGFFLFFKISHFFWLVNFSCGSPILPAS